MTNLITQEPSIEDLDFDHIAEAKEALADVITSGRLDFTAAIAVAQTHALISIAQSLESFAFDQEVEDIDLTDLGISVTSAHDLPAFTTLYGES